MVVITIHFNNREKQILEYDRSSAIKYAHIWSHSRNKKYYDFSLLGGDCTNFCSQILYAGSKVMNYTKTFGWHYINSNNKTPSWTGVNFFYDFLIKNKSQGPFAEKVNITDIIPGDFIQLSFSGNQHFEHSLAVVQITPPASPENILIATHTIDRDYYPLSNYNWADIRYLHILGVYK